ARQAALLGPAVGFVVLVNVEEHGGGVGPVNDGPDALGDPRRAHVRVAGSLHHLQVRPRPGGVLVELGQEVADPAAVLRPEPLCRLQEGPGDGDFAHGRPSSSASTRRTASSAAGPTFTPRAPSPPARALTSSSARAWEWSIRWSVRPSRRTTAQE